MTADEITKQRQIVVAKAKEWLGTAYHHEARIKGVGVDCAQLLLAVFHEAGIIPDVTLEHYPFDWHMHRDAERYLIHVLDYTVEVEQPPARRPLPGDICLWRFGRTFSHGAIVIEWPTVIHSYLKTRCCYEDVSKMVDLTYIGERTANHGKLRPMRVFAAKGWVS